VVQRREVILNIWGIPKEKRTQLYFRDDGNFIFRKLDIEDGFLVEKNKQGEVIKAWMMRYKLLKRFDGYGSIGADMVTVSFARDIVFDPFDQLKDSEKPDKGANLIKDFVRKIAEAKCYRHEMTAKGSLLAEKIVVFMGATMVLLALGIGIKVAF